MGRSKPTFRNYLDRFEGDWQPYRRTLRRRDQAHFDRLFERARGHADAAGQLDPADPRLAILFSMLLAHERQLQEFRELRERLEDVERRVDPDGGGGDPGGPDGDEPDGPGDPDGSEPGDPAECDGRG